mgnify:CR=1 FL=1
MQRRLPRTSLSHSVCLHALGRRRETLGDCSSSSSGPLRLFLFGTGQLALPTGTASLLAHMHSRAEDDAQITEHCISTRPAVFSTPRARSHRLVPRLELLLEPLLDLPCAAPGRRRALDVADVRGRRVLQPAVQLAIQAHEGDVLPAGVRARARVSELERKRPCKRKRERETHSRRCRTGHRSFEPSPT